MFENYNTSTIPNNLNKAFPEHICQDAIGRTKPDKPFEMYNDNGKLVGYFWYYGDTVTLSFTLYGEYSVESDAITTSISGDEPTTETVGYIGQKYYNFTDKKAWKCVGTSDNTYVWEEIELPEGIVATSGYLSAEYYFKDCEFYFSIYNFRNEQVYNKAIVTNENSIYTGTINVDIDNELSQKLVRGTYHISLVAHNVNDGTWVTVFDNSDATFLVK